jgi:hypothetical protein
MIRVRSVDLAAVFFGYSDFIDSVNFQRQAQGPSVLLARR